jgi:hypothetical protein
LGKDADFLYDTIENYIIDAEKSHKIELVKISQTINNDRKRHMHLLKVALEKCQGCLKGNIESIPIAQNEGSTFDYDSKR